MKTLLLIVLMSLLCGCGVVTSDRVYFVCKIEDGITYCYKDEDSFYMQVDGNFVPTSGVRLKALPALHIIPKDVDYSFEYVLPGLYNGTLHSVNGYVHELVTNHGGVLEISYCDWNNIDAKVLCDDFNVRIVFNITGEVRMYAVNDDGYMEDIPYINIK